MGGWFGGEMEIKATSAEVKVEAEIGHLHEESIKIEVMLAKIPAGRVSAHCQFTYSLVV